MKKEPTTCPEPLMPSASVDVAPGTLKGANEPPVSTKLRVPVPVAKLPDELKLPTIWPALLMPLAWVSSAPGNWTTLKVPPVSTNPSEFPAVLKTKPTICPASLMPVASVSDIPGKMTCEKVNDVAAAGRGRAVKHRATIAATANRNPTRVGDDMRASGQIDEI